MKISPWPFGFLGRLARRERLVVGAGAGVSAAALLAVLVVLPLGRSWLDREDRIAMRAGQLARLEGLISQGEDLRRRQAQLEQARAAAGGRLLEGETAPVAASVLQMLLDRYANESHMTLDRVDAVSGSESKDAVVEIPVRIALTGDIYGLVDLLFYIHNGEKLLVVDELQVQQARVGPAGEELLAATVSLHGFYRRRAPG
jgi:hypothetical protein